MADDDLSLKERAIMLALMAEARELTNKELEAVCGQRLDGAPRRRLNERKLVTSEKRGRLLVHELHDNGWVWCREELSAPRPPRAGSGGGALYALLGGLARFLDRTDTALSDVFRPDVEQLVRAAYLTARPRPGAWVMLSTLREHLDGVTRDEVDAELTRMITQPGVHLAPESNQQALTAEHRAAAVHIGGQDKHLLLIEDA